MLNRTDCGAEEPAWASGAVRAGSACWVCFSAPCGLDTEVSTSSSPVAASKAGSSCSLPGSRWHHPGTQWQATVNTELAHARFQLRQADTTKGILMLDGRVYVCFQEPLLST